MTKKETNDHWASLSSELGLTPPPSDEGNEIASASSDEVVQRTPAETAPTPPSISPPKPPASSRSATPRPRPAANWDLLASELGVAPPPRPAPKPTPVLPEPVAEIPVPAVCPSPEDRDEPTSSEVEIWDEPIVPLLEPVAAEAIPEAVASSEEPAVDRVPYQEGEGLSKSGRRRRRRRRRGKRLPEPECTEEEILEVDSETANGSVELIDEEPESAADESAEEAAEEQAETADRETPDRKRRRRSRRGGRRSKSDVRSEKPERSAEAKDESQPSSEEHDEDDWRGAATEEDEPHDDEDAGEHPWSHKGIPTWGDAVEIVIAKNLESRSKNPSGGSGGRNRGGRRSREKHSER